MLRPSKEENLTNNLLVQGSRVLALLKGGAMTIDELRSGFPKGGNEPPAIDRMMDILTYLHLSGLVSVNGAYIRIGADQTE